jgi:hypothetical protein
MTTLSNGINTLTPLLVDGYESSSEAGNIVHRILGAPGVDVILRPATLPAGTMTLNFGTDEAAAAAAEDALRTATVWTLATGDRTTVDMTFVVTDTVERLLDDSTRDVWTVSFGWQEVTT